MKRWLVVFFSFFILCAGLLGKGTSGLAAQLAVPGNYVTIQAAINAAISGDVVIVSVGVYYENITFFGKTITVKSEDPNNSALVANTIIDGNLAGRVITFTNGEGQDTALSGFTIQNGNADDGGGISCNYSSPRITNCTITNNLADDDGGGIYCSFDSSPSITNCTIADNSAGYNGGGIRCIDANPIINNCTITNNSANDYGGGIYCSFHASPTITNCTIAKNSAKGSGGGIYCYYSNLILTNCTITNNSALLGAGIYCHSRSFASSSPYIINCTIANNSAFQDAGGIYCSSYSTPTISNCILWGDTPNEMYVEDDGALSNVSYSCIQRGEIYQGEGNRNDDPLFVSPNIGNYYLQEGSPCIDQGTFGNAPEEDKEGISRPQGAVDMGAYEYVYKGGCIPRASFIVDQSKGMDPLGVLFDASSSGTSQFSEGVNYTWNFGDGNSLSRNEATVSYTYSIYGTYEVSLDVTTSCGSHMGSL